MVERFKDEIKIVLETRVAWFLIGLYVAGVKPEMLVVTLKGLTGL